MIEFKDGRYVVAVWIWSDGILQDWIGVLYRDFGVENYTFQSRHKYRDEFGKTQVEWHQSKCVKKTAAELEKDVDRTWYRLQNPEFVAKGGHSLAEKVAIGSDQEQVAYEKLQETKWVSGRDLTTKEELSLKRLAPN